MSDKKAFKDWFDAQAVNRLAEQFCAVDPTFDKVPFCARAKDGLLDLEFQARVQQIADALASVLPTNSRKALEILVRSLPPCLPDAEAVTEGWLQWPLGQYIASYTMDEPEASLDAMEQLTQRFSAEFAIRPYLRDEPEIVFARLASWATHSSEHVRRLASEGCRPRLPWGLRLHGLVHDPAPVFSILEMLKDDSSEYVRRSVANNLNDIAKDHPESVVDICREWNKEASVERKRLIKSALRTLIKDGNPGALDLLGFGAPTKLTCDLNLCPESIRVGQSVSLQLALRSEGSESQNLMLDYAVTYVRKGGKTGRKVFKWTQVMLDAGESIEISKEHPMRITSVRALYPGLHGVEIQLNGHVCATGAFELLA